MFRQIFNPENTFWRLISRGVDWLGLSILWIALCLPLVPFGAANAALYFTVVRAFRQGETATFTTYLRSLKENFKNGCLATAICLPAGLLMAYGYSVMRANAAGGGTGMVLFVAYYVALLIPCGIMCYLFPLMGRFSMGFKALLKTAVALTLRHLPTTIILVLLNIQLAVFTIEKWWPVLVTPVAGALISSLFLEKIFLRYLPPEEQDKLKDKRPEEEED